jgi:glycosyltransferase involved in cell wall biosynthesis
MDAPPEGINVKHDYRRWPNKVLNAGFAFLRYPHIDRMVGGADVLYMPNLNFAAASCRIVVTVHDLSFYRYPEFFSPRQRLWHRLVNADSLLKRAGVVIAVSRHTKDDIVETFGIDQKKIRVVTPAVSGEFRPRDEKRTSAVRRKYALPDRFILYLGTLEPRKNVEGLIRAFDLAETDIDLVIAGGRGWMYDRIFRAAEQAKKRERIRFLGYVDEWDKPALYSAAEAFAYPSFYEGFGMPALEAMACGTPVIASHASSLGEVVGDAGLLINPAKPEEIAYAIDGLMSDSALRERFRAKGMERSESFSWEKGAKELESAFMDAVS